MGWNHEVENGLQTWAGAVALGLWMLSAGCGGPAAESSAPPSDSGPSLADAPAAGSGEAGEWFDDDGFVVWESRRSGAWRLWTRRLDGSGLSQLTPDEEGRHHCCAHISPDGQWVTYLSLPNPRGRYSRNSSDQGPLRLVKSDGTEMRDIAPEARTYFENRAAVWRSATELIYIAGDGHTILLDLDSGRRRKLTAEPAALHGWLINGTMSHATMGRPTFSPFRERAGRFAERGELGGCQPYFSHDGRWGFWTAGAGGPIDRIDLATGRRATVLRRNDSLVPQDRGYLYFPMLSDDGGLLAVAGSDGTHSHFKANYDVLVLPTDPRTFEVAGPAVQFTFHPGPDRFPDVWRAPMPLGRHWGEAPLKVSFPAPGEGRWQWSFGDGAAAEGSAPAHTFERPGVFRVEARKGDRLVTGLVTVERALPPILEEVRMRDGGRRVELEFDEPVSLAAASARLSSGNPVARLETAAEGRVVVAVLEREITTEDRLTLDGLTDMAQVPNRAQTLQIPLELPGWPAATDGLAFLWETANSPNAIFDAAAATDRTFSLERTGGALLDRDFAMVLDHGVFEATEDTGHFVSLALKNANEVTIEATLTSRMSGKKNLLPILSLGVGRGTNLELAQEGDRLLLKILAGREIRRRELMQIPLGEPTHVVVSYKPGRLTAYRNGDEVLSTDDLQDDFYHWDPRRLRFGSPKGEGAWPGTLQGVAIYARALTAAEVGENHDRFRRAMEKRRPPESITIEGVLVRSSEVPTLEDISPYREALSVQEYEVRSVLEGAYEGDTIRVAQWSILDGQVVGGARTGEVVNLRVEPLSDNPQLESVFVSDTLGAVNRQIFYAADPGLIATRR